MNSLRGIVHQVIDEGGNSKQSGKPWQKRTVVVRTEDQSNNTVPVVFFNAKINDAQVMQGQQVDVQCRLKGKEHLGKYYAEISGNSITVVQVPQQQMGYPQQGGYPQQPMAQPGQPMQNGYPQQAPQQMAPQAPQAYPAQPAQAYPAAPQPPQQQPAPMGAPLPPQQQYPAPQQAYPQQPAPVAAPIPAHVQQVLPQNPPITQPMAPPVQAQAPPMANPVQAAPPTIVAPGMQDDLPF